MTDQVLVVLNVAPGLEEPVVDWLLGRSGDAGFTSIPVFGHGADSDALSVAEQVAGRRRRLRFEVAMPRSECRNFLEDAVERFGATDMYCMTLPVLAEGAPAAVRDAFEDRD